MENLEIGDKVYSRNKRKIGKIIRVVPPFHFEVDFAEEKVILGRNDLIQFEPDPLSRLKKLKSDELNELDESNDCILKAKSYWLLCKFKNGELSSLSSSKVQIYPHQVSVVHRVCKEGCLRFLIADEVGLGKTIEAGLILKELKTLGWAKKILIVVPANLVNQWKGELKRKFNEDFEKYDYFKEKSLKNDHLGVNPWKINDQIICSIPYARNEKRIKEISKTHWDLVIVDEAHHLRKREKHTTKAYHLGEELSQNCYYLLLLTATPLQLEDYEFVALLELINPEISNLEEFRFHKEHIIPRINEIVKILEEHPNLETFNSIKGLYEDFKELVKNVKSGFRENSEFIKNAESIDPEFELALIELSNLPKIRKIL